METETIHRVEPSTTQAELGAGQHNLFTRELERTARAVAPERVPEAGWLFDPDLRLVLPEDRAGNDLRHVAVATVAAADALVSWNFRHLVNVRTRRAVHAVNLRFGYPLIEIISPEEV
jgi:hypothetical protein